MSSELTKMYKAAGFNIDETADNFFDKAIEQDWNVYDFIESMYQMVIELTGANSTSLDVSTLSQVAFLTYMHKVRNENWTGERWV